MKRKIYRDTIQPEGPTDPWPEINALRADLAAGMGPAECARKYKRAIGTIAHHLQVVRAAVPDLLQRQKEYKLRPIREGLQRAAELLEVEAAKATTLEHKLTDGPGDAQPFGLVDGHSLPLLLAHGDAVDRQARILSKVSPDWRRDREEGGPTSVHQHLHLHGLPTDTATCNAQIVALVQSVAARLAAQTQAALPEPEPDEGAPVGQE